MAPRTPIAAPTEAWPELALDGWRDTYATLHLWTQIVGKTRAVVCAHAEPLVAGRIATSRRAA